MSAGFDAERIERLFGALASARGVLVAVSGGPDSVALMRLIAEWAARHPVPIHIATVDHGLRLQSRNEAEQVAAWAEELGLAHAILTWIGEKPTTRIQERGRTARYDLLRQHAQQIGADHILTAHHAEDQAETILFRLLRGSGPAGLAGMAGATKLGDVTLLRPLLAVHKAELVDYCRARGQTFLLDPSNENPRYARARLRQIAPLLAQEGLDAEKLVRLGLRAARAEAALQQCTVTLRASLRAERSEGRFAADLRGFAAAPEEILLRLLELEIGALSPSKPSPNKPLRLSRLESLASALTAALRARTALDATLAGTKLSLDRHGTLVIRREGVRQRGLRPKARDADTDAGPTAPAGPDLACELDGPIRSNGIPVNTGG